MPSAARMRHGVVLAVIVLVGCSGGGGSGGVPTVPALPWGSFRHDFSNSAVGSAINRNQGGVRLLAALDGDVTGSTPAVDRDGHVYLGTGNGVVSFDRNGQIRWSLTQCVLPCPLGTNAACVPCPNDSSESCVVTPIGTVSSSPTVTAGNTIVFGSEGTHDTPGAIFLVQQTGGEIRCQWFFRPFDATIEYAVVSSPAVQIDPLDRSVISVFFADASGDVSALNADGTVRWIIAAANQPITSSPALDASGTVYVTTPDGTLVGVDSNGRARFGPRFGVPPEHPLLPSPGVALSAYVVGAGGALFAYAPGGGLKWQFTPPAPINGSPAFLTMSFNYQASTVVDTIVYGVDTQGMVYPVRDSNGTLIQPQRCTGDLTRDCRMDSCEVAGTGTCLASDRCSVTGIACTRDSCGERGPCVALQPYGPSSSITGPQQTVTTSAVLSADAFVVVGTAAGDICARGLNGFVPGQDLSSPTPAWTTGCITVDSNPTISSPVIGLNGNIFVTTSTGLYVIE